MSFATIKQYISTNKYMNLCILIHEYFTLLIIVVIKVTNVIIIRNKTKNYICIIYDNNMLKFSNIVKYSSINNILFKYYAVVT
jgi:hypothetical protein